MTDESQDGASREATLVLAHAEAGRREPECCTLGRDGVLFGRDALVFPGGVIHDSSLSRRHAEVRRGPGGWVLRDLGSRNGTWVNGVRLLGERGLGPGDVVKLGSSLLLFAWMSPPSRHLVAPSLVGPSDALGRVRRAIATAAGQRKTILVTGETGTGKELVARALHEQSGRVGRLVAMNCGAIAEGVLTSELFGHVRGAFTGAQKDQAGLFREADRGTLFLDEIGELPTHAQAQLLRVLEEGKIRPVGSPTEVGVDTTVIAATNRDLVGAVRDGRFRADLYARLAQWIIHVPPLRERREDLPWLIRHLLARTGTPGRALTLPFAEALFTHPWPLNVRGLLNVLSIAALVAAGAAPLDLHPDVVRALDAERALAGEDEVEEPRASEPSREQLEAALTEARGVVSVAARRLGASRQQLYRWLEKLGIEVERFR